MNAYETTECLFPFCSKSLHGSERADKQLELNPLRKVGSGQIQLYSFDIFISKNQKKKYIYFAMESWLFGFTQLNHLFCSVLDSHSCQKSS